MFFFDDLPGGGGYGPVAVGEAFYWSKMQDKHS